MSAIVLGPGEGEAVSDFVKIKLGRGELAVTESHYPPGKSGPEPHIHKEHADCFWVLGGRLHFVIGPDLEPRDAEAGTFVHVPPDVVHSFRNEGPDEAHFLNLHAPSKGFHDYMRAMRDGRPSDWFDSFDPPEDGGRPASEAMVLGPGDGEKVALGPSSVRIKAGREHPPGGLALMLSTVGAGFPGPVLHTHETMVDSFYVLDGVLTIRLEDGEAEAEPGAYAAIPPGVVHSFANRTDSPVRMLNVMAPAGLEQYFRDVAASLPGDGPPDPEAMAKIAARYDFVPAD